MKKKKKYETIVKKLRIKDWYYCKILKNDEEKDNILLLLSLLFFVLLIFFTSYLLFSKVIFHSNSVDNVLQSGSILFSYQEGSNVINIDEALPISDEAGRKTTKDGEIFEFYIAGELESKSTNKITYEISLTPKTKTLSEEFVRINLMENEQEVLINNKVVNKISELENSNIRENSKLIYKKEIFFSSSNRYIFRMWLGEDYTLTLENKTFSCYINVDAY